MPEASKQITTLNEFIEWVERLKKQIEQSNFGKCLFRGLSNNEYSIEASAWRRLKHEADRNNPERFLELNQDLIEDARLYEHDRENERELKNLEILAKLQHFRAATCLIDFTYSAQVALWFACQASYRQSSNSEELAHGKVCVVFDNTSRIKQITQDSLNEEIHSFFEANEDGGYPLYQWQPRQLNNRIFPQYSVFLFGGARIIEPDVECVIAADSKQKILASLEDFSQTTEATLFPDFEGFVDQRTQARPYDILNYREQGYRAYQNGRYEEAITYCDEAINRDPDDVDSYRLRGDAKVRLEQYSEAIADFDNAIRLNPGDRNSYKLLGDLKLGLGHFDEAKEDFQKALELAQQVDDTFLVASIALALREIDSRTAERERWTLEKFKELIPERLKALYEGKDGSGNLYQFGAELQNLIEERDWTLNLRFGIYYFVFYSGRRRVFGVNLFGAPRLAVWGTEEERIEFPECEYDPTYYPPHKQWVYPREATVEDLREIFEFVYRKHIMRLWEDQEIVDALKHILEDYDYLEYDEEASRRTNGLRVKVSRLDTDRDFSVTGHICRSLEQVTGRLFFVPGVVTHGSQNWETEWTFFTVRER